MIRESCKTALRESLLSYLLGKVEGRSIIKSRANAVTIAGFFLFWPNHLMSFHELKRAIGGSSLNLDQKVELTTKFDDIKYSWITKVEETLRFIAETFEDDSEDEPEGTSSQAEADVYVCGVKLSADLPTGQKLSIEDELQRYRSLSIQEFSSCE